MNTVEMLRLASRVLGISPKDAMRAAEHLYLDGLISYPRTESSGYPSELAKQLPGVVLLHVEHDEWGAIAATIVDPGTGAKTGRWTAPRHGTDAGDHPPIMPCRCAEKGELSGREARLYSLVVREFLASLMPDCAYVSTTATLLARSEVSGCAERFTCRLHCAHYVEGDGGGDAAAATRGRAGRAASSRAVRRLHITPFALKRARAADANGAARDWNGRLDGDAHCQHLRP